MSFLVAQAAARLACGSRWERRHGDVIDSRWIAARWTVAGLIAGRPGAVMVRGGCGRCCSERRGRLRALARRVAMLAIVGLIAAAGPHERRRGGPDGDFKGRVVRRLRCR